MWPQCVPDGETSEASEIAKGLVFSTMKVLPPSRRDPIVQNCWRFARKDFLKKKLNHAGCFLVSQQNKHTLGPIGGVLLT